MLNELAERVYRGNRDKGFWDKSREMGTILALIHSEVSEALECDRKEKYSDVILPDDWDLLDSAPDDIFKQYFEERVKDTFEDELADIVIRVLDLCGHGEIDLDRHIQAKLRYNSLRPHKHGKAY